MPFIIGPKIKALFRVKGIGAEHADDVQGVEDVDADLLLDRELGDVVVEIIRGQAEV